MCFRSKAYAAMAAFSFIAAAHAGADTAPKIDRVRAHLYYAPSGRFDERDLLTTQMALWNTIGGGGDASEASRITLVLVEVSGRVEHGVRGALRLHARTPTRSLSEQEVPLYLLHSGVRNTVPFLVYGTGCEVLTLELTWTGVANAPPATRREIPFACGE
ncbi:MAG: hypothetical protein DCC71_12065 [Proteobacteria bacterium]|nr:MAG: hypothetical protein DCC71_12065 [Pseudomonadota bacterium]